MADQPASPSAIHLGRLASGLSETCAEYLASHKALLGEAATSGDDGVEVARRHAAVIDGLLSTLCCAAHAAARAESSWNGRFAVVAVGGFGRRLVAPHSDLDVLFLCDDPSAPEAVAVAEAVFYPLWDLGLDIGHAVRSVDETLALSRVDIRTATTLLDLRHVVGDKTLTDTLIERARSEIFASELDQFLRSLEVDTTTRHERFGGSVYLLEPEIKLGRGGLRDLDVIGWYARARWGVSSLKELLALDVLKARELNDLLAAEHHMWRVRNFLHREAGRRLDRLTFEFQESVARQWGYADAALLGVEQFMQVHYRHARAIAQMVDCIVERARRVPERPHTVHDLGGGLLAQDDRLLLRSPDDLFVDPTLALRFYAAVVQQSLHPHPQSRDAIAEVAALPRWAERLRSDPRARALFLELLTHVHTCPVRQGSIINELHEVGMLCAMIPEFEHITGRVQHDVYHVYTVDVHSIAALDCLRKLARGELAVDRPMASRLAAEVPRRVPLHLAVLLHDIGRAKGKDHAETGAVMARSAAEQLGLSSSEAEHVEWLVRHHLDLYHWATRRDVSDPDAVAELAHVVGTVERLRDLYLVTVADRSTVSPSELNEWKLRMFDDVLAAVTAQLEDDAGEGDRVQTLRSEIIRDIEDPDERARVQAFLSEMPDRYALANSSEAVRCHARLLGSCRPGEVLVAQGLSGMTRSIELLVATDDRPGLLADITCALAACRFSVSAAQLYRRLPEGWAAGAFDLFLVEHPDIEDPHALEAALSRLREDIAALCSGRRTSRDLLDRRSKTPSWARRKQPRVPTEIRVDNAASSRYTVVDVFTRDRPELLHAIAQAFHGRGVSIVSAKVNTEGRQVADVFYVEEERGGKLPVSELAQLSVAVRETIDALGEE